MFSRRPLDDNENACLVGAPWGLSEPCGEREQGLAQRNLPECYPLLVLLENKALGSGPQEAILQGNSKDGNTANSSPSTSGEAGRI